MSKLDTLFVNFKSYCKKNPPKKNGLYTLNMYDDSSGSIMYADYTGTESNPFFVEKIVIVSWFSISEGVQKIGELLNDSSKKDLSEST